MFRNSRGCRKNKGVGQGRNFCQRQENTNQFEQPILQNNPRGFGSKNGSGAGNGFGKRANKNNHSCQGNGKGMGLGCGRGKAHNRTFASSN